MKTTPGTPAKAARIVQDRPKPKKRIPGQPSAQNDPGGPSGDVSAGAFDVSSAEVNGSAGSQPISKAKRSAGVERQNEREPRWASRIVGEADVRPTVLIPNVSNFRRHPKAQQRAMTGALDELGWIQRVIVNKRTGHIIDGHLRVEMAIETHEATVPVCYVDLSEDEERLALATFDPISAMAMMDEDVHAALLASIECDNEALAGLLMRELEPDGYAQHVGGDQSGELKASFDIIVNCADEESQAELLYKLTEEGFTCRSLIA